MRKQNLIVIIGPTAVGKTAIAIELAKRFGTEIISADSRQIFKEMNIGTAKPTAMELSTVPHHFINSHSILQEYDAAQFGQDALKTIHLLFKKYNTIILCGGSGLYVKAVCEGFDDIPDVPDEIRKDLVLQYERGGISWLQERMRQLDPRLFELIDKQNPHRLMRALEVKIGTGQSITTFQRKMKLEHAFNIIKIGLELNRQELYERIDTRMDKIIEASLFDEVAALYPFKNHNALQTVGYQEIFDFMEGKYDREETIRLLKLNSRRYAKRQMTWFKRDEEIHWFSPLAIDEIFKMVDGQ